VNSIKINSLSKVLIIIAFIGIFSFISINSNIQLLDFSPDKEILEVDKNNGVIKTNDFDQPIWSYTTLDNVEEVEISSDGSYIAAASSHLGSDGYIYFFHKSNSTPLWTYTTEITVESLEISQDGKILVAALTNGHLFVFNTTNYEDPLIWDRLDGGVIAEISSNGSYIVTSRLVSMKIRVYYYHISSSTPIWTYQMESWGGLLAMSSDGFYVAAQCYNYKIYLFNKYSSTPIWEYYVGSNIIEMSISSNNSYLVAGTSGSSLLLFNITNYSNPLVWEINLGGGGRYAGISANGDYIVCKDTNDRLYLFNKTGNSPIWVKDFPDINSLEISSDGNFITVGTGYGDSAVYLFSRLSSDYLWKNIMIGVSNVYSVDISSNGLYVISGSNNKVVDLFYNPYPPFSFELTSDAENPDDDGSFKLEWEPSMLADNYSVYFHTEYFTSIHDNVSLLEEDINYLYCSLNGLISGNYYYVIVAKNKFGIRLSNCLEISVSLPPGDFLLTSDAGNPDLDGAFSLNWTISKGADNYSVYLFTSYITEINNSLTIKGNGFINLSCILSLWQGIHYFVVVSYNKTGYTISNNVLVKINIPPRSFILSTDTQTIDTDGLFNISWSLALGANNYSIYIHSEFIYKVNDTLNLVSVGNIELNWTFSGLNSGTYYILVVAFNNYGNISSNCIQIIIGIPPGVFNLSTNAGNPDKDGKFNLNWTMSKGADNYSIYLSSSYIFQFSESAILFKDNLTNYSYLVSSLISGNYYILAVAFNNYGNISSNCIQVIVSIPPGEFNLSANAGNPNRDGNFNLNWTISKGADNYSIYLSSSYIFQFSESAILFKDNLTYYSYFVSSLISGNYFFLVVAFNNYGNISSNCIQVIVSIPPGEFNLSTNAGNPDRDGNFNLNWTMSKGADNYSIYLSSSYIFQINENSILIEKNLTNYSYLVTSLISGNYFYVIVSLGIQIVFK